MIDIGAFKSFRDEPDSPFHQAHGLSPRETWAQIYENMEDAATDATAWASSGAFRLDAGHLCHWHRQIFGSVFPADAGRFRWKHDNGEWEHVYFGITIGTALTSRTHPLRGANPRNLRARVDEACQDFMAEQARIAAEGPTPLAEVTMVLARMYAKLLRIHPFVDGNLRAVALALQAGLISFDLPTIAFDEEDHDAALNAAFRPSHQSYEPLSALIERSILAT